MGPPSYMWSVVDQNVVMWRTTVVTKGDSEEHVLVLQPDKVHDHNKEYIKVI